MFSSNEANINNADSLVIDVRSNRLDFKVVSLIESHISSLEENAESEVFINLNNVRFIDNAFFEMLSNLKGNLKNNSISLFGMDSEILASFFLLNMDKYFMAYSDEADAISRKNPLIKRRFHLV